MKADPIIGIIGVHGQYGQWLKRFFEKQGYSVIGSDLETELSNAQVVEQSDVVIFTVPIQYTTDVILDLTGHSHSDQLWMDVTSVKKEPVAAMLTSKAEVCGLHPMSAPPKNADLKGQILLVCEENVEKWKDFLESFLAATQADVRRVTPEEHDKLMAAVQDLPHAAILSMASVLRNQEVDVASSLSATSPFYRIVWSLMSRILAQDPGLYADIQLHNPDSVQFLKALEEDIRELRETIEAGDREKFLEGFKKSGEHFGEENLKEGYDLFDALIDYVKKD